MDLVTGFEAFGGNDVASFAIFVFEECDVRSTVRVIFEAFNNRFDTVFISLEVNQTILLFVATTDMPRGNSTIVIATTGLGLLFQ